MNWILLGEIAYFIILVLVCGRVIYDTRSVTKTLAYLLTCIFVPIFGLLFYFSFGINYHKRKLYSKKLVLDDDLFRRIKKTVITNSEQLLEESEANIPGGKELVKLLLTDNLSPLTGDNKVKLLINGEEKFPEVLSALKQAQKHIHIEYYIFEDDETGTMITDMLIQKAKEGLAVRFIYDDFGSRSIRKKIVPRLKEAGVQVYPFYEIIFLATANRINYRNHRKIIVIDGTTSFVGGINISDRYVNNNSSKNWVYWRDTHIRIDGSGTNYLQYVFLCDWNFCANEKLSPEPGFFTLPGNHSTDTLVQIAASGPDSNKPTILYSLIESIGRAKKEILITTPYFIPGQSLQDMLCVAAMGGVSVKLLVPGISDSRIVNAAARSYYEELLEAGVEIYLYNKGFIHAKTIVMDGMISMVGTANMDYRSFELNFEVNAIIYDNDFSKQLQDTFYNDLKDAERIELKYWRNRPIYKNFFEKIARLVSSLI
jgi:cardiolipin synthase